MTSLRRHIEEIRQFLREGPIYHLFGVAESRLDSDVDDIVVQVEGSTLI